MGVLHFGVNNRIIWAVPEIHGVNMKQQYRKMWMDPKAMKNLG